MTPQTILVVDDDPNARLLMRAALRQAGFAVRLADSGEEGLRQYRDASQPCDMVMLDVDMPGMDGHAVCQALRAEAGALLPIVMVTGMDDVASVQAAYRHGATDFIAKPVHWAMLGHRLRYLLRSHDALLALQAEQARTAALLEAIPDLLFELDAEGRYQDVIAHRSAVLAAPVATLLGRRVHEVLPPAAAAACMAALQGAARDGHASGQQYSLQVDGRSVWFELSVARKQVSPGAAARFILLARDISERKDAEARIARMAFVDALTGLPNRRAFLQRVDAQIAHAARAGSRLAVLFLDLDGFKAVNDSLGHATGDRVLQAAAARLRSGLRPADPLARRPPGAEPPDSAPDADRDANLARLGGDEFTALLLDLARPEDALEVAQRIGTLLRAPFAIDGHSLLLSSSIGVALYPDDGHDAAALLQHADTAMYQAKRNGRDQARLYSRHAADGALRQIALQADVRQALGRGELSLVYQPQVALGSARTAAVEALLRWQHPQHGWVAPAELVALAEAEGVMPQIGAWVLRSACEAAAGWNLAHGPVRLAVNLSARQLAAPGLVAQVQQVLADSGLAPQQLELELTEAALAGDGAALQRALQALRALGVGLALDDFGTGQSALACLARMPIGRVKLDCSCVAGLLDGTHGSQAIVRAVLALAASLDLPVTAEGVETVAQAQALQALGCDSVQGWCFSHPVPAAEVPALLQRHWVLPGRPRQVAAGAGQVARA